MTTPSLFDLPEARAIADTSLIAFDKLQPISAVDLFWLRRIYAYLRATGYVDVTGKELADYYDTFPTTTRPRIHGCKTRGWLLEMPTRLSRARHEGACHGYRPTLPEAAVERALQQIQTQETP